MIGLSFLKDDWKKIAKHETSQITQQIFTKFKAVFQIQAKQLSNPSDCILYLT